MPFVKADWMSCCVYVQIWEVLVSEKFISLLHHHMGLWLLRNW